MQERRIVITGTGIVSCVGNNVSDFWNAVTHGQCGIGPVTRFDTTGYRCQIAGEIKNLNIADYIDPKEAKRLDLFTQYAIVAADQAMKQAGFPLSDCREITDSPVQSNRFGVLFSSGIGGLGTLTDQHRVLMERGPGKVSPFLIPKMIIDIAPGVLSMRYGATGPNYSIVTACSSSCHSIGESFWMIKRGDADVVLTGGAEATIVPIGFAGFSSMQALSERNDDPLHASRPFDAQRDGFVMSEGAGALILEEYEHAKKRGATILAEIVGYGASADAYHITSPAPGGEGAARAFSLALHHARINPDQVDYINAHGTSTVLNDKFETAAIKSIMGDNAYKVSISSIKGTMGHSLGAAGAIESIACIQTILNNVIPPTINYEYPDPECDLDITPNKAKEKQVDFAVNTNLGFGGHNAAVVFKRFK